MLSTPSISGPTNPGFGTSTITIPNMYNMTYIVTPAGCVPLKVVTVPGSNITSIYTLSNMNGSTLTIPPGSAFTLLNSPPGVNATSYYTPGSNGAVVNIAPNSTVTSQITGVNPTNIITPFGYTVTTVIVSPGSNVTFLNSLPPVPIAPLVPFNANNRYYDSLDAAVYKQLDGSNIFYFIPYYAVHLPASSNNLLQTGQTPVNPFTNPYVPNNTFANMVDNSNFEYLNLSAFNSQGYRSSDDDYFYNIYGVK